MANLHRPIYEGCQKALLQIFSENRHADKIVDQFLKSQKKWGSRDRRQFAETVYEIVRWWRRLHVLSELPFESRVTAETVDRLLKTHFEWQEKPDQFRSQINQLTRAEKESVPDSLDELGQQELGDRWPGILHALNQPAKQYLRVNHLKTNREQLIHALQEEGVVTDPVLGVPTALVLRERKNVFTTRAFLHGDFEMQDAGSQQIAPLLGVEPGMRVIDACAGAGGKTLHLAALMKNKGKIIALDIHAHKLEELKKRAARAGASLIEAKPIESTKTIKRLEASADRVLLDVPCSGLGVLRRMPDTKWKFSRKSLDELAVTQNEILNRYSKMVRPGGVLVYATCSILPSENTKRVQEFLKSQDGSFELETELTVDPSLVPFDGFYAARLKRCK